MRYVACLAADDLEAILTVLRRLVDPTRVIDLDVWENDCRLVATVLDDGTVIRFDLDRPRFLSTQACRSNGRAKR